MSTNGEGLRERLEWQLDDDNRESDEQSGLNLSWREIAQVVEALAEQLAGETVAECTMKCPARRVLERVRELVPCDTDERLTDAVQRAIGETRTPEPVRYCPRCKWTSRVRIALTQPAEALTDPKCPECKQPWSECGCTHSDPADSVEREPIKFCKYGLCGGRADHDGYCRGHRLLVPDKLLTNPLPPLLPVEEESGYHPGAVQFPPPYSPNTKER